MTQLTQGSDMELRELLLVSDDWSFCNSGGRCQDPGGIYDANLDQHVMSSEDVDLLISRFKAYKQRSIDRAIADMQPDWWITTGLKENGKKLLGPFSTRDLALSVRTYMEMAEAPATYWVEQLSPTTTEDKEDI